MRIRSVIVQKFTFRRAIILTTSLTLLLAIVMFIFFNLTINKKALAAGPANGDYRSITSGNWNTVSTWQKYNGASWVAAAAAPTSANGVITIQSGHSVTITSNLTADQVVVNSGGLLILNSAIALTVANGTSNDLDVFGTFKNAGTITINGGAKIVFENGGTYQHNYTSTAGTIPTATWSSGSTCEIIGYTTNAAAPAGLQTFDNFTWNCPSQSADISLNGGLTNITGTFSILNTGATNFLRLNTTTITINIGGDFIQNDGNFELIKGNAASTMNVSGNFNQTGGTFTVADGNNNASVNLSGNFSHTSGTITQSGSSVVSFVFKKAGIQTFISSGNSVTGNIDYTVNSGSTIDVGTSSILGRNFTLSSGAGIMIGPPDGITNSGATGNVQVSGTRSFNTNANYTYDGSEIQVSGNGLPSSVKNLTINNSSGVTLINTVSVGGILTLSNGKLLSGPNEIRITNTSTSAITGHSASNYIVGNLRRSVNGSGSYDFPVGTPANYELTNVNLSSVTGATDLLAFFTNAAPETPSLPLSGVVVNGITMDHMITYGYWTITPNNPIVSGNATVTVTENGQAVSNNSGCTYSLLNRSNILSPWASVGTHNNNTQVVNGNSVTAVRSALNVFGDFAIAYGELLSFTSPSLSSGVAGQVNAIYIFPNVCSNVDAWVQIVSLDGGATLNSIDNYSAGNGYNEAFQPYINAPPNTTSSILWDIMFKIAGTSTDTTLPSLAITGVDIDAGSNVQEFVEATYPYSYGLYSGSALTVTNNNGSYMATASAALGSIANIDTSQHQAMFQINYKNINHFYYRTGVISSNNSVQTRQTSLYFKSFFSSNYALPIRLLYFEGKFQDHKVLLSWATATETNNNFFTVERSEDGETFEPLLDKHGAENSTVTLYYSAVDDDPLPGTSFYRLKQTDYDGHFTYSDIIAINSINEGKISILEIKSIAPDPFSESFTVNFYAETKEIVSINMMNYTGQIISQDEISAIEGFNSYRFPNLSELGKGVYFITLTCKNQKVTRKIIRI